MLTMEVVNLIVGICALLFAIWVYIIHDRKLKRQQKILNEYQLINLEHNIAELKKAEILLSIKNKQCDRIGNRSGTLVIKNCGMETAYNVRLERECYTGFRVVNYRYPQLRPQEERETNIKYPKDTDGPVVVTWDDKSGKDRTHKCTLDW